MKRKMINFMFLLLMATGLVLCVAPVFAGGWATVGITEMPEEVYAGRPFTLEFMVWQHGNKAVHNLAWDNNRTIPVTPKIILISPNSKGTLTFTAEPAKAQGLFTAEITVPEDGLWQWSIAPEPLEGVTEFEPLTVTLPTGMPDGSSIQATSTFSAGSGYIVWAAAGGVLLLGILILAVKSSLADQDKII